MFFLIDPQGENKNANFNQPSLGRLNDYGSCSLTTKLIKSMLRIGTFSPILIIDLSPYRSAFLRGARKIGKTTYLKKKFSESANFDL